MFVGLLVIVAFTAVLNLWNAPQQWMVSATTLAVMVVTATCDLVVRCSENTHPGKTLRDTPHYWHAATTATSGKIEKFLPSGTTGKPKPIVRH